MSSQYEHACIAMLGGSAGFSINAVKMFASVVHPQPMTSSVEAAIHNAYQFFAEQHSQGMLTEGDFVPFCRRISSDLGVAAREMPRIYAEDTLRTLFRAVVDDVGNLESPGSLNSSMRHLQVPTGIENQSLRKEELRMFLEDTRCPDGDSLLSTPGFDIVQFTRDKRDDVSLSEFIDIVCAALKKRSFERSALLNSVVDRRRRRRESQQQAKEKIMAAMNKQLEDDQLKAEQRVAASPSRRRAISPFAFGSWRRAETQSHQLTLPVPETVIEQVAGAAPPATYQPVPSLNVTKNAPQRSQGAPNSLFMDIPMINVNPSTPRNEKDTIPTPSKTTKGTTSTGGAATSSGAAAGDLLNASYDFSAHNSILDETFSLMDAAEGGSVTLEAIYELCAAFPNPPQPNAVRRLFHLVDVNASNDIDREEFEQLCFLLQQKTSLTVTEMCGFYTTAMYRRLFELLDDDGDESGTVSREELRVLLEAISPILQANFSSNDVYRLTKDFGDAEQLTFPQFQQVVKLLIKGKSISKVVSAFEEVLRRRRLLKRQALERFAQPIASAVGKKHPPPPKGAPPPKACNTCSIQARRIIELEDQLAKVQQEKEDLERNVVLLRRDRDGLRLDAQQATFRGVVSSSSSSGDHSSSLRGDILLRWFASLRRHPNDGADHSARMTDTLAPLSALTPHTVLDSLSRYAADLHRTQAASIIADPSLCPMSGDKSAWFDCVFSALCGEASGNMRDLGAAAGIQVLPLVTVLFDKVKPLSLALSTIVASTEVGSQIDGDDLDDVEELVEEVRVARDRLHHVVSTDRFTNMLRDVLSKRDTVHCIAYLQTSASHKRRVVAASPAPTVGDRSPRSRLNISPDRNVTTTAVNLATNADALASFQQATACAANFIQCLTAFASQPLDAELIATRLKAFPHLPLREGDAETISQLQVTTNALSSALSDAEWARCESNAAESLAEVKGVVSTAIQQSKRDKSVMTVTTDGSTAGDNHSPMNTPSLHMPPRSVVRASSSQGRVMTPGRQQVSSSPAGQRHSSPLTSHDRDPLSHRAPSPKGVATSTVQPQTHDVFMHSASPRVRTRREVTGNSRSVLDRLLQEFLEQWRHRIPSNFERVDAASSVFHFGSRKLELSAVDNFVVVKVGGGYLLLEEFCEKYAAVELRRWNLHMERGLTPTLAEQQQQQNSANRAAVTAIRVRSRSPAPVKSTSVGRSTPQRGSVSPRSHTSGVIPRSIRAAV